MMRVASSPVQRRTTVPSFFERFAGVGVVEVSVPEDSADSVSGRFVYLVRVVDESVVVDVVDS